VARNKVKRRLRHIVRSEILPFVQKPFDAVLSAQVSAYAASYDELRTAVKKALADEH
jgi:ribonuclease P protein component